LGKYPLHVSSRLSVVITPIILALRNTCHDSHPFLPPFLPSLSFGIAFPQSTRKSLFLFGQTSFSRISLNYLACFTGRMVITRNIIKQAIGTGEPKQENRVLTEYTDNLQDGEVRPEKDFRPMKYVPRELRIGHSLRPKAIDTRAISHLNWDSSSQDIADVLQSLQKTTTAYVHPRPLSFQDQAKKKNLVSHLETQEERQLQRNDTFTEFWSRSNTPNARGRNGISLFLTHCQSRTAKPDWKGDWWHCWGITLLKKLNGNGKVLIIYDCDTDESRNFDALRPKELLLQTQCQLIDIARKNGKLDSVWIGNAGLKPQKKWRCIFHTAQWIQQSIPKLDEPFQGPEDDRITGFHHIKRR